MATLSTLWAAYASLRAQADQAYGTWAEVQQNAGEPFAGPFYSKAYQLYEQAALAWSAWAAEYQLVNPAPPPGPPPAPPGLQFQ